MYILHGNPDLSHWGHISSCLEKMKHKTFFCFQAFLMSGFVLSKNLLIDKEQKVYKQDHFVIHIDMEIL